MEVVLASCFVTSHFVTNDLVSRVATVDHCQELITGGGEQKQLLGRIVSRGSISIGPTLLSFL
jgi:hypothetical protein